MSETTPLQGERVDAIGDLLQTLGRAPFDLDAVLATILHRAVGLCGADRGFIYLLADGSYHHAADVGATPDIVAFNREHPIRPTRGTLTGRTVLERRPVHIPDVLDDPAYDYADAQRLGGFRAMLGVPMLRNDVVVGVLDLWRDLPQPFTSAEIELVTQFSDGAAIAIELTRLARTIDRQRLELSRYVSPQVAGDVASLVESWRRSGFELGLGIGIATGYATLGRIGFRVRVDYAAIGTVVNLAARLCVEATHQQILLPARTHALVESIVEVSPRGDVAMKGFERPVRVVEVIALAAAGRT